MMTLEKLKTNRRYENGLIFSVELADIFKEKYFGKFSQMQKLVSEQNIIEQ